MPKINNLLGEKFGKLTVLSYAGSSRHGATWNCKCDCGNVATKRGSNLSHGIAKSCGCLEKVKQGNKGTRLKNIWKHMKSRCIYAGDKDFYKYGGRGICVYDGWVSDFIPFKKWAISNGYAENLTLDRIDNNGNYEPSNCRWTTMKEQANNKRNNILFKFDEIPTTPLQLSEKYGVSLNCIYARLKRGETGSKLIRVSQKAKLPPLE